MKNDVLLALVIQAVIMGASLVAYAHANFASKSVVETMDSRIYEIYKVVVENKRN